jgi:hypothetical protein
MSSRRWIILTISSLFLVVALNAALMLGTDVFGLFRDPVGRQLPIYYADRTSKFLLSQRYVPANYDGLLLGPSSSINWQPRRMMEGTGLRVYNESLEGGNATEENLLAEQALKTGHFKVAIVVLYPTMVGPAEYHDGLDKASRLEALGSLDSYVQTILTELAVHHIHFENKGETADGSHEMRSHGVDPTQHVTAVIDPAGLRNLQALVAELQQHGTRVIYVIPTIYEPVLAANRSLFDRFREAMRQTLPPAPLIDLNAPEYAGFRSDATNYVDDFHLSSKGAATCSEIINLKLRPLLQSR